MSTRPTRSSLCVAIIAVSPIPILPKMQNGWEGVTLPAIKRGDNAINPDSCQSTERGS